MSFMSFMCLFCGSFSLYRLYERRYFLQGTVIHRPAWSSDFGEGFFYTVSPCEGVLVRGTTTKNVKIPSIGLFFEGG